MIPFYFLSNLIKYKINIKVGIWERFQEEKQNEISCIDQLYQFKLNFNVKYL